MSRLLDALRGLDAERLTWFGAGLGAATIALLALQLGAAFFTPDSGPLPPRVEVVQAAEATRTPFATATAWPGRTPLPTRTPWPTDTPFPTRTPWPTRTPRPTATPRDTPTPWPTRTPFTAREPSPSPAFSTDVADFADRIADLSAAISRASVRLACRTPVPVSRDAHASPACE